MRGLDHRTPPANVSIAGWSAVASPRQEIVGDGGAVNCKTCIGDKVEIAAKTIWRAAAGITRCHRLECGHAWHVAIPTIDARLPLEVAEAARCNCGEIATVNGLLVDGRQHAALGNALSEDAFKQWLEQVLEALDGIPAEIGAQSLVHSATLAAKSKTSGISEKTSKLNKLLGRAIKAVS